MRLLIGPILYDFWTSVPAGAPPPDPWAGIPAERAMCTCGHRFYDHGAKRECNHPGGCACEKFEEAR